MMAAGRVREQEIPPRASVLVESLRGLDYSLQTSAAEFVDNSVAAGARNVELLAAAHAEAPAIGILGDDAGMTEPELLEAMRPGSRSPLENRALTDLGQFGLGLTTASFSQCRRHIVVTRKGGEMSRAVWDLDTITARDKWIVERPLDTTGISWSERLVADGTLVVWEKLDRLVRPDGRT